MVLDYPTELFRKRSSLCLNTEVGYSSNFVPVCGRAEEVSGCGDHDGVVLVKKFISEAVQF